jgi:hypothetical protein
MCEKSSPSLFLLKLQLELFEQMIEANSESIRNSEECPDVIEIWLGKKKPFVG